MADTHGRPYPSGPYTPGDEPPLAFERRRQPKPERPRRGPPPVTLILSAILLLGVGGAVAFMYRAGLRAPGGAPHPVGTPIGEVRVAAPPQAQPPDPAAGLTIYKEGPAPAAPAFTPPPEQPLPRAGAAPELASGPSPSPAASAAPVAPSPAQAPQSAVKAAPPDKAAALPAAKAKPKSIDTLLAAASGAPTHKSGQAKAEKPVKAHADAAPIAAETAKASDTPAKHEHAVSDHAAVVQIGAFSSRALAEAAASKGSGGHAKRIVAITRPDGTVLYRASLAGFASRDAASAFCGKLKAAGDSCFVPR